MEKDRLDPATRFLGLVFLVPLCFALVELVFHCTLRARVVPARDFEAAAAWLRPHHRPRDLIVAAPSWADPRVRAAAGAMIDLDDAGATDLDRYDRLWSFSIRGHRAELAPNRPPDAVKRFGRVRLERWDLGPSPVIVDLVDRALDAEVSLFEGGVATPCQRVTAEARNVGLGAGAAWPRERILCAGERPWLFVAKTVNEDLDLKLRRCVWQHPQGREPIRATFRDIPLGERVVLFADVYSEHERMQERGPFQIRVLVDGQEVATMVHEDGQGRVRIEGLTQPPSGPRKPRGDVSIDVTASAPDLRTVCWSATIQGSPRDLEAAR